MLPLSTSSREAVWFLRPSFLERRMENTDAASVELMTAPVRKLSRAEKPSAKWQNSAVSSAVTATPRVDSTTARAAAGRAASQRVPKQP